MSIYNEDFEQLVVGFAQLAAEFLDSEGIGAAGELRLPVSVTVESGINRWPLSVTVVRSGSTLLRLKVSQKDKEYRIT